MLKDKLPRTLIEERKNHLNEAESFAKMGSWNWKEHSDELKWSEGLYKIFNKNLGEDISWDSFLTNVLPEDLLLLTNFLSEIKTSTKGSTIEYRILHEGEIHFLSLTSKPHINPNVEISGALVDVTQQKKYTRQLEQHNSTQEKVVKELDEKEKKYRSLFERSIDPIFLTSSNLVLMDVNDSFLRYLEYSDSEIPTLVLSNIFENSDDYNYFRNTVKEARQIKDFEVSLLTKNGDKKLCLMNCAFIPDQTANLCCYQGIIHDLTVRKQAESDILIAERFSLTGKIARTIAHEVRNPLTNLNLALHQLREEISPDNESAKFYGDIIERNVGRIEKLIDEMLNTSKPKGLNFTLTNVNEVINDAISQAIDRIKLRQIKLHFTYQKNLPRILLDKKQIQIALLNIILNAVEAMEPKKGILRIDASGKDKVLTIAVSDNGTGIPVEDMGKLFEPFFTDKPSGKGLGLTSTKNILTNHNAQIDVKSELNKGTTFYIYFTIA